MTMLAGSGTAEVPEIVTLPGVLEYENGLKLGSQKKVAPDPTTEI